MKGVKTLRKGLKGIVSLIIFLFVLPLTSIVLAEENKIADIDIQVKLQEDGSATIHEKRAMEVVEDTEVYIELSNLGESELIDFDVASFEEETDWDIDASFDEKAFKYGVLDRDEGYELAWGISEYGQEEYNLTYGLTNMVRELEDGQALFWNFDSFLSLPTDKMTLEISADFDLSEVIQDFYGFGFEGPLDLEEGVIRWTGSDLDESNDVILLLQFPMNTFQTKAKVEMTLEEQRELALEGSSYNDSEPMPFLAKVVVAILALLGIGGGATAVAYGLRRENVRKEKNHFNPHKLIAQNKNKISKTPPALEEDIPHYAALISKLAPTSAGFSEFFFAYLLLWAEQEKIQIELQEEKGFFGGKKNKATIHIANFALEDEINRMVFDEYVELFEIDESRFDEVIWGMLLEVADAEGKIEGSDIQKWSEKNAESIAGLVDSLEKVSMDWLVENNYMNIFSIKDWGFSIKIEELTAKGQQLVEEILQYQNFIEKIKDTPLEDDEDWESLIIWSAIFGHAEDTVNYLEEFEPETWAYLEESYPYIYGNYYGYHYLYRRNSAGLASAGYSSSGSGFSSAGGGMGAGGGGGGGTR